VVVLKSACGIDALMMTEISIEAGGLISGWGWSCFGISFDLENSLLKEL